MNNLTSYLERFKQLIGDKKEEKESLQRILMQICCVNVSIDHIAIKEGVALITVSPIEKTELLLKKKEILSLCKEKNLFIIDFR